VPAAFPADWPAALVAWLTTTRGAPAAVTRLGGMSGGQVYRCRWPDGTLIVKASASATEAAFYTRVAPRLRAAGVPLPALAWALELPQTCWLALEDIPQPLELPPHAAWQPDPRQLSALARLHATTREWTPDLPTARPQSWTDDVTAAALTLFPAAARDALRPRLVALQAESQRIFAPWCWISGDPNPLNWGVRADGTLALFDWELFGPGTPAIDLGILVPGLGAPAQFAAIAAGYRAAWPASAPPLPWDAATLARDSLLTKVASVARLLHAHAAGTALVADELVAWLVAAVPDWLATLD
jgi:hypothetical protein